MAALIHKIEYLKVPHPLKEGEVIIGHDYGAREVVEQVYRFYNRKGSNIPRLERILITPTDISTNKAGNEVKAYEANLLRNSKAAISRRKIKDCAQLGAWFSLSHLIWSTDYVPAVANWLFTALGDSLGPYARVILTIAPALYGSYKKFFGLNSFSKRARRAKPLGLYEEFGRPIKAEFIKEMKDASKNIKEKLKKQNKERQSHPVIGALESCIETLEKDDEIEVDKYTALLQSLLNRVNEDDSFPWGEKKNLADMTEDLLYHLNSNFHFAPLKVISPIGGEIGKADEVWKAENLREFLSNEEAINYRESIMENYTALKNASTREERIRLADKISMLFQRLSGVACQYATGEEKGVYSQNKALRDFYHHFFVSFGRLANELGNNNIGRKKLIRRMEEDAAFYLNTKISPKRSFMQKLAAKKLAGPIAGLTILASTMGLTGFHVTNKNQFSIVTEYKLGYKSGARVDVVDKGIEIPFINKRLNWSKPKPFAFTHKVNLEDNINVYMPLKEAELRYKGSILNIPKYAWEKSIGFFKKGYGATYTGLDMNFKYEIANPELWKNYDYDGRGKERLSRDLEGYLTPYTGKTRGRYREKIYNEHLKELNTHFMLLLKKGQIGDWIKRFLYPSIMDEYRVGSVYDMYTMGLTWLKVHPAMEKNEEWKRFVEDEIKYLEKTSKSENEDLITKPMLLKKMIKNPDIRQLQEFQDLYSSIVHMATQDFINEKVIEDTERRLAKGSPDELTDGFLDYMHNETEFEKKIGIKLIEMERSIKNVGSFKWARQMQRRQNLI